MKFLASFVMTLVLTGCQSHKGNSAGGPTSDNLATDIQIPTPKALDRKQVVSKIQFGSCAHQKNPQPLWKTMLKEKPDLYVGVGDNIYASSAEDKPIETAYRLQSLQPEFAIYRSQVPMIATWDDHDYGANDGGADNPEKETAKLEFLKFWPNDALAIDPRQNGVYHSFILGSGKETVQVILLDTRYFRDPLETSNNPPYPPGKYVSTQDKSKTILGSVQWQWLTEELKKPSTIKIIVSSIQAIPVQHGFEKWDNFPHEREKLLNLLGKYENIFLMSGDRHAGEISKAKRNGKKLLEITASGINRPGSLKEELNKYRVGEKILENNFGQMEINWQKKEIFLSLIGIQGQKLANYKLKW